MASGCCRLFAQAATGHAEDVTIEGEAGIDYCNEDCEDVAHVGGPAVVLLGYFQGWCGDDLLPTEAHVCAEDDDCSQIEEHPAQ